MAYPLKSALFLGGVNTDKCHVYIVYKLLIKLTKKSIYFIMYISDNVFAFEAKGLKSGATDHPL